MKKIFKNPIFMFVLGIIISGTTVMAVTQINASDIVYTNTSNQETTVEAALNNLYTTANKPILNKMEVNLRAGTHVDSYISQADFGNITTNSMIKQNYSYFKISNIAKNNENNSCYPIAYMISQSQWLDITADTEYDLSLYNNIGMKMKGYANNAWATCSMLVTFYNK